VYVLKWHFQRQASGKRRSSKGKRELEWPLGNGGRKDLHSIDGRGSLDSTVGIKSALYKFQNYGQFQECLLVNAPLLMVPKTGGTLPFHAKDVPAWRNNTAVEEFLDGHNQSILGRKGRNACYLVRTTSQNRSGQCRPGSIPCATIMA